MTRKDIKSQYPLNALLKLRQADLDLARIEVVKARKSLEVIAAKIKHMGMVVEKAENEFRVLLESGEVIDQDRHIVLSRFLEDRQHALQAAMLEIRYAELLYEQSRERLSQVKQGVMVLEKHKDTKRLEYIGEMNRLEQNQIDDLWLQQPRKR